MTKHAPSPWKVSDCMGVMAVQDADGDTVCTMTVMGQSKRRRWPAANARIIAAAPTMLAALELQCSNIERWLRTGVPAGPEESRMIYEKIQDAIAEARGE